MSSVTVSSTLASLIKQDWQMLAPEGGLTLPPDPIVRTPFQTKHISLYVC